MRWHTYEPQAAWWPIITKINEIIGMGYPIPSHFQVTPITPPCSPLPVFSSRQLQVPRWEPEPIKYSLEKRLPLELLLEIIKYLQFADILNLRLVCKYFSAVGVSSGIFRSLTLLLCRPEATEAHYPFFYTGLFYHSADKITIVARLPLESTMPNSIYCSATGLLSRTTSVLHNLSKITLDAEGFDRSKPLHYGTFFVEFFSALYADLGGQKIQSLTINNLPLWILQLLGEQKPEVLRGSLTGVKQLSLSFVPVLQVDVNDRVNFYRKYDSFTEDDRGQLRTAYNAVRAFLVSAEKVEELEFGWFSDKLKVITWKALSPIGDLTSLCKPTVGADAARLLLIGGRCGGTSWVDDEGKFTVVWQSIRVLKLSKLITCHRQLLTAILGAKNTIKELQLSEIQLNRNCGNMDWHSGFIMPLWGAEITRNGQKCPFRLEKCTLSQLGYTSGLSPISQGTLVKWMEAFNQ